MNIEEAKAAIKSLDITIPVFLWGPPGIGKSALVKQLAQEAGIGFKDVRLTTIDPTDLRGLPYVYKGKAYWADPTILPQKADEENGIKGDEECGYLLLDEINSAHTTIQAGAYELAFDRRVGGYALPEGWHIIAAGNREGDRGVTFQMPRPLLNRFAHIELEVDKKVWTNWAMKAGVSPTVIAFIESQPGMLNPQDKDKTKRAFPTPRTWEYTSRIIKTVKNEDLLIPLLQGTVGDAASHQFVSFLKLRHKLPNLDKIFAGKQEALPDETSLQYAFYAALCGKVDDLVEEKGVLRLTKDKKFIDGLVYCITKLEREFVELVVRHLSERQGQLFVSLIKSAPDMAKELTRMYGEMMSVSMKYGGGK